VNDFTRERETKAGSPRRTIARILKPFKVFEHLLELLHVLAQDVGIEGIFSDWPATVTYYANCMGLK